MSNVVSLSERNRVPHSTGPAVCLHCGHKWVAVVPEGYYYFSCPECELEKGVFEGLMVAEEGEPVFCCTGCGNHLFLFRKCDGGQPMCIKCGNTIAWDDLTV